MKLNPFACGFWDGVSVWLQWNPIGERYSTRVRYRKTSFDEWGPWIEVIPRQGKKKAWGVLPTWKEGWHFQAEISVDRPGQEPEWELAKEIVFEKSKATFEISSSKYHQKFAKDDKFHAIIDCAACTYTLPEDLEVEPGVPQTVELIAQGLTGFNQLDHENHFDIQHGYGVRIRNTAPSINDIRETGKDFVIIQAAPVGVFNLALGGKVKV